MAGLGDLLGAGDAIKPLLMWGLLNQVLNEALAPYLQQLANDVNAAHPVDPLSPPDLATAVVRNYMDLATATAEAAKSGLDAERFTTAVHLAGDAPGPQQLAQALQRGLITADGTGPDSTSFAQGIAEGRLADKWTAMLRELAQAILSPADAADAANRHFLDPAAAAAAAAKAGVPADVFAILTHLAADAPAPGQLAEALRRGLITADGTGPDSTSFAQGIAEGRLGDKWTAMMRGLAQQWPSPADALRAALQGQVPATEGKALYEKWGGDPQWYQIMFDTEGSAPTPLEAVQMAERGIIGWTGTGPAAVTYQQAFLEGPWRNKWQDAFKRLGEYVPPPETVRTLLEQGAIDQATASDLWAKSGLAPDTIKAYLQAALFNNLADTRGLSTSAVLDMYYGQLVSKADAVNLLELFQVPKANVDLLLAYVDMRRSITAVNTAVSRIQTLFATRKIGTDTAKQALERLQVPGDAIDSIITTWEIEASVNVKTLTESQIAKAVKLGIMDPDTGISELTALGYTPYDAWVLLSNEEGHALPNPPPRIVAAPLGDVIPGVT